LSRTTSEGLESLAFHLTQLEPVTLEALVHTGSRLGLDIITGDDWALLAGPRARLSALARPWTSPAPLVELATALGHVLPAEDPLLWQTARGPIALDRPVLVGVLTVTPDSFSDGGQFAEVDAAMGHAARLLAEGATILDIGRRVHASGSSGGFPKRRSWPGLRPVIEAAQLRFPDTPLSIDTVKSGVARVALDLGVAIVNDVSGLRHDSAMPETVFPNGRPA
jgi:hypothetical protein